MAASGVYDGTAFHRVVKGFVIQGGYLPSREGAARREAAAYVRALQPEFNQTPHDRGILSMARGDEPGQRHVLVLHRPGAPRRGSTISTPCSGAWSKAST